MTTIDWRTHGTPEAHSAFLEAQTRLDHLEPREDGAGYTTWGVDHYTREMMEADEKLAEQFDRLVLQPAHAEFEQQCEDADFNSQWPEPPDGSRIEFEANGGIPYAAYRMDDPEVDAPAREGGTWWMFGDDDRPRTWRQLVVEFEIWAGPNVEMLVPVAAATLPVGGEATR